MFFLFFHGLLLSIENRHFGSFWSILHGQKSIKKSIKNRHFGTFLISGDDDEIWGNIIPCNIDL